MMIITITAVVTWENLRADWIMTIKSTAFFSHEIFAKRVPDCHNGGC